MVKIDLDFAEVVVKLVGPPCIMVYVYAGNDSSVIRRGLTCAQTAVVSENQVDRSAARV